MQLPSEKSKATTKGISLNTGTSEQKSSSKSPENYCEFLITINYPIIINNCLPYNVKYKFLDWETLHLHRSSTIPSRKESNSNSVISDKSLQSSRNSVATLALTNVGSKTIANIMNSVEP